MSGSTLRARACALHGQRGQRNRQVLAPAPERTPGPAPRHPSTSLWYPGIASNWLACLSMTALRIASHAAPHASTAPFPSQLCRQCAQRYWVPWGYWVPHRSCHGRCPRSTKCTAHHKPGGQHCTHSKPCAQHDRRRRQCRARRAPPAAPRRPPVLAWAALPTPIRAAGTAHKPSRARVTLFT